MWHPRSTSTMSLICTWQWFSLQNVQHKGIWMWCKGELIIESFIRITASLFEAYCWSTPTRIIYRQHRAKPNCSSLHFLIMHITHTRKISIDHFLENCIHVRNIWAFWFRWGASGATDFARHNISFVGIWSISKGGGYLEDETRAVIVVHLERMKW